MNGRNMSVPSEHSSAFVGIFKNLIRARGLCTVHKAEEKEEMLQGMYG